METLNRLAPLGRPSAAGRCPKRGITALLLGPSKPAMVFWPWRCGKSPWCSGPGGEGLEGSVVGPFYTDRHARGHGRCQANGMDRDRAPSRQEGSIAPARDPSGHRGSRRLIPAAFDGKLMASDRSAPCPGTRSATARRPMLSANVPTGRICPWDREHLRGRCRVRGHGREADGWSGRPACSAE